MTDAPDLYAILGIDRDASPQEIKRAMRRGVARQHPDVNAAPDAADLFQEILLAHDVLLDPARRAKYDATGKIDPDEPDNTVPLLIGALSNAFNEAMASIMGTGRDPASVDIVQQMIGIFRDNEASIQLANAQLDRNRALLTKIVDRFEAADGTPNHMQALIRAQIGEIDRNIATNEVALEQARAPRLYLEGCKYRHQDPLLPSDPVWKSVVTFTV